MTRLSNSYRSEIQDTGLLLLRLANIPALAALAPALSPSDTIAWVAVLIIATALSLGVMTRATAWSVAIVQITVVAPSALAMGLWHVGAERAAFIIQAVALACIGPGAYSLDARWFGRRLIFESPAQHTTDDGQ